MEIYIQGQSTPISQEPIIIQPTIILIVIAIGPQQVPKVLLVTLQNMVSIDQLMPYSLMKELGRWSNWNQERVCLHLVKILGIILLGKWLG